MSQHGNSESFLERNWYWFVIAFGVIFVTCINCFHPVT